VESLWGGFSAENKVVSGNKAGEFSEHDDKTYQRRRGVNLYKLPAMLCRRAKQAS